MAESFPWETCLGRKRKAVHAVCFVGLLATSEGENLKFVMIVFPQCPFWSNFDVLVVRTSVTFPFFRFCPTHANRSLDVQEQKTRPKIRTNWFSLPLKTITIYGVVECANRGRQQTEREVSCLPGDCECLSYRSHTLSYTSFRKYSLIPGADAHNSKFTFFIAILGSVALFYIFFVLSFEKVSESTYRLLTYW